MSPLQRKRPGRRGGWVRAVEKEAVMTLATSLEAGSESRPSGWHRNRARARLAPLTEGNAVLNRAAKWGSGS